MIKLILLFLMVNLSLELCGESATNIISISKNEQSTFSLKRPSIKNTKPLDNNLNNVVKSNPKKAILPNKMPGPLSPPKRIPRQFNLRKTNEPHKIEVSQPNISVNPIDNKAIHCIHCRPHRKIIVKEAVISEITSVDNKQIGKHWNINPNLAPVKPAPKKRILIFMSKGGGGHISVSNALKSYLDDGYEITIANFFEDVMSSVDTVRSLTFGIASGEDIYNFCLQNRFISLVNGFTKFGAWTLRQKSPSIEPLLQDFITLHKPDLIISVIPVVNFMILPVAKKLQIPFLVVTNDLDTTNYINGITKIDYDKFYYTVSFKDRAIFKKFKPARIPKSQVAITGFPLRPEFYDKNKNKALIKKDFQIPPNKKVIMILMGGAGSFVCYRYVRALARLNKPMHLVACIGRDERLRESINGIYLPPHITLSIVGFTNRISDLMTVSDLLITKAGPNSICEAMASGLPILIDQTTGNIWWEVLNVKFVTKNRLGDVVKRFKDINNRITKFLEDTRYVRSIKSRMSRMQAGVDFRKRIRCLIDKIVA